nr:uncharacterized protein LOC103410202 isoform X2 [Malus domestica]
MKKKKKKKTLLLSHFSLISLLLFTLNGATTHPFLCKNPKTTLPQRFSIWKFSHDKENANQLQPCRSELCKDSQIYDRSEKDKAQMQIPGIENRTQHNNRDLLIMKGDKLLPEQRKKTKQRGHQTRGIMIEPMEKMLMDKQQRQ